MKRTLLPVALTVLLSACTSNDTQPVATTTSTHTAQTSACTYRPHPPAAKPAELPSTAATNSAQTLTLNTTAGSIPLLLNADHTPCTVNAIAALAEQGYYDNTTCHRLTTSDIYVLQCGDPSGTGQGGPGFQFDDEYPVGETPINSITYPAGTLAMANAGPNTNGSQFFLTYEDSPLPPNYTIFGSIASEGLDVVRQVAAKGTASGTSDGVPAEEVRITKATIWAAQ